MWIVLIGLQVVSERQIRWYCLWVIATAVDQAISVRIWIHCTSKLAADRIQLWYIAELIALFSLAVVWLNRLLWSWKTTRAWLVKRAKTCFNEPWKLARAVRNWRTLAIHFGETLFWYRNIVVVVVFNHTGYIVIWIALCWILSALWIAIVQTHFRVLRLIRIRLCLKIKEK